ncbi:protein IQ-domain 26-like [Capsicum chacoense]
MGKATRWFKGLLGMNKDKQNVGMLNSSEKRDKKRWSFRRKSSKESTSENLVNFSGSVPEVYTNWLKSCISEKETEQRKHAIAAAAAAAIAAAGDAAVAAAQVAAAMVRLTSQGQKST